MFNRWRVLVVLLAALVSPLAMGSDLLVKNVRGVTPTVDGMQQFSCMTVSDGRVETLATGEECGTLSAAEIIDGKGRGLLPGLIDAHGHVLWYGLAHTRVDLVGTKSLEEALQRVKAFADAHPDHPWILGRGWNQEHWPERKFPTAADLDKVVPDRPVWLGRIDGHAGWANSAALKASGVNAETENPHGGMLIRDEQGRPSGVLVDAAEALVGDHVPELTMAQRRDALATATRELAAFGLTGVHDAGVDPASLEAYRELAGNGGLAIRIYAMLSGADYADGVPPYPFVIGQQRLLVQSIKLYIDGAMGSRGAAFMEPYKDDPENSGLLFMQPEQIDALVAKWSNASYQVNVHAIGDLANKVVLDAFEKLDPVDRKRLRHRIEHVQVVAPEDLKRFATLGIVPSMQPVHVSSDWRMLGERLEERRLVGAYAWRSLLDDGNRIAAGSDFPVESPNPMFGLYAAVTRLDMDGEPEGGWHPDQKMTLDEALRAFTLDAAWAAHQERELGSLEKGKWADFILVDRDLYAIPAEQIKDVRVLGTWVAGENVYLDSGK
ncbi:MAG: amidohydrolase [Gammaproteobacteria bacterium]|jgi:predicted amidohydrolase YtcJ|nr:amidohydrolase [Gammaproteobacteria bacterium]